MVGGKIEIASMDYCFEKFDYNREERFSSGFRRTSFKRVFCLVLFFNYLLVFKREKLKTVSV